MGKNQLAMNLRALEPSDIDLIYTWENDPAVWRHSAAHIPFSRHSLTQYVMEAQGENIFASHQLRLMADVGEVTVGCVDLFDFDPYHNRAGVGILVDTAHRGKGYAQEMLRSLIAYAPQLRLHQLYCHVVVDNDASVAAFLHCGFHKAGVLKDWIYDCKKQCYVDAYTLQIML